MKGYDALKDDLVNYEGIRHKVIEVHGDSLLMFNLTTQRQVTISKFHSVTMVERPRRNYPPGIDWRVYSVKISDEMNRRCLKKNMTFHDADAYAKGLKERPDTKYIVRNKSFRQK